LGESLVEGGPLAKTQKAMYNTLILSSPFINKASTGL